MKLSSRILILVFACMLLLTSCTTKEENADNKATATIGATATATPITETTGTPDVTPTPQATTAPVTESPVTTSPTEDTTPPVEETTAPVTTQPVTDTTPTPQETTPPVDTQPIADPEQFPDDWGISYENNAFRTDRKEFLYWTKTRHLVEIPKNFPTNWVVEMIDEKNEQIFIRSGKLKDGTCVYYALVNGVFYKLSEEKIIDVTIHNKKFAWIEDDGTAYSINIRTKWFNEVYVEATGAAGIGFRNNELIIVNQDAEMIEKNQEDILREVKKVSN